MPPIHKVLLHGGWNSPPWLAFFRALTPPEFELVTIERPDDHAAVAATLRDVQFIYGSTPPGDS